MSIRQKTTKVLESEIRVRRTELDRREDVKANKQALQYVGRAFLFRNSYGGDSEKWNLYAFVIGTEDHGYLTTLTFQKTSMNIYEVRLDTHSVGHYANGGYQEITAARFWAEWDSFHADLTVTASAARKEP